MEGRLYTFDDKVVDQNYFSIADSRNYCLGLPGWCPCINCAASTTSSSTVAISDNEPDEVTQLKNVETVYSEPLTRCPLSLNRRRKRVASEECSESPAVATGSKKPQKSAAALPEERFSFDIGEDDLEIFKKGECPPHLSLQASQKAIENDVFYLIPLPKKPLDETKPWYTVTPMGKISLMDC